MLAIQNQPFYKHKFFLSSLAVLTGFLVTVGIIQGFTPENTTQSNTGSREVTTQKPKDIGTVERVDSKSSGNKDTSVSSDGTSTWQNQSAGSTWSQPSTGSSSSNSSTPQGQNTDTPEQDPAKPEGSSTPPPEEQEDCLEIIVKLCV